MCIYIGELIMQLLDQYFVNGECIGIPFDQFLGIDVCIHVGSIKMIG